MKKPKLKLNLRKTAKYVAALVVVALVSFQAMIDVSAYRNLIQSRADQGTVITNLIGSAVANLNKPAPVDAASGKVYVPEARLVMPAYTGLGQIEYQYESGQYTSNDATEIHLTSSQIINLAKNKMWVDVANANNHTPWQNFDFTRIFPSVPSLQACTRGVQIFYARQPGLKNGYAFQGSHRLRDGRTLYVYSETGCKQDQSAVINLAKQAQSY